jgi:hypothetical protein
MHTKPNPLEQRFSDSALIGERELLCSFVGTAHTVHLCRDLYYTNVKWSLWFAPRVPACFPHDFELSQLDAAMRRARDIAGPPLIATLKGASQ